MSEILVAIFMSFGSFFMVVAGLGLVRMPDLFLRMSSGTKAATLGVACIATAVAIHFGSVAVTTRAIAIVFFMFMTAPVAAHIIAKAAYTDGTPLWKKTLFDDLRPKQVDDAVSRK